MVIISPGTTLKMKTKQNHPTESIIYPLYDLFQSIITLFAATTYYTNTYYYAHDSLNTRIRNIALL